MAEAAEKAAFLGGLVVTFKEQMHTDVLVKPGQEGPPIPTHKAVLVCLLFSHFCTNDIHFGFLISDQSHNSSLKKLYLTHVQLMVRLDHDE